jgi:hypothetical protein
VLYVLRSQNPEAYQAANALDYSEVPLGSRAVVQGFPAGFPYIPVFGLETKAPVPPGKNFS